MKKKVHFAAIKVSKNGNSPRIVTSSLLFGTCRDAIDDLEFIKWSYSDDLTYTILAAKVVTFEIEL